MRKEINNTNAQFKHIAILVPAVAKSFHANADRRPKKKHESTTLAIRNAGESADMKVITSNKLTTNRKVKCLEIPHYAYTSPLGVILTRPKICLHLNM